ncbi:hypothetical protein SBA3_5250003 [Candidatus Sulfopaludibacter sp. SbA3]|nr:hypothetical protein SBA3_5250003 [Candidatus Sulfopaludibacter sp. SbA3]
MATSRDVGVRVNGDYPTARGDRGRVVLIIDSKETD